jgi:hypothetical protein
VRETVETVFSFVGGRNTGLKPGVNGRDDDSKVDFTRIFEITSCPPPSLQDW